HFYGLGGGMHSPTLVSSGDWKGLKARGIVAATGSGHAMLKIPVAEAAQRHAKMDFGGNPHPVITVDEFGFDYDGQIDLRTAETLRAIKKARPELGIAVWQMRGPVAPKLAATYLDEVDLVMMETYVSPADIWLIGAQLKAAELNGLGHKSVVGLGIGRCGRDHVNWARSKEELEEQVRFIRAVAPHSPGLAFFGLPNGHYEYRNRVVPEVPITLAEADDIAGRFRQIPTDGTGLRPELKELAEVFTRRYEQPAIVCSTRWVHPNRDPDDWRKIVRPASFRAFMMNLGERDAENVIVTLRMPKDSGGYVLAKGLVDIPARSTAVAVLPRVGDWEVWIGRWDMELETTPVLAGELEIEAPGCEVLDFKWTGSFWEE
ncbi:MAG: hypothetical protein QGH74_08320, partial [Candidatus Brocadiia bacterium]|nr:hypothetical protein [Candidatus Brocadiia bacterium]